MSIQQKNLLANYSGQVWTGIASLLCIPFYISILGLEQYGFIGIFALMQSFLPLLECGLGNTLVREVSHNVNDKNTSKETHADLLRTVEIFTLTVSIVVGLAFQLFTPEITSILITNTENLNSPDVIFSIR